MKKRVVLFSAIFLFIVNFVFALSLLTPSENNTNPVPVLMTAAGDSPNTISLYTNKVSISSGDVVVFHIHGYANGGDVKNTRFRLDNVEKEFKAGSSQIINAYVSADNAPTVNGAVTVSFNDDVRLVYKNYTWATRLMGLEPEPTEHFHKIPNGVSGRRAMSFQGVSLGDLVKDHRSNLILYFKAEGKKAPVKNNTGKIINGICGNAKYTCAKGKAISFDETSTRYAWICQGFFGGIDQQCSTVRVVAPPKGPVDGKCSVKTVNGCIRGWKKDIKDSDKEYLWICKGLRGGSDANCSIKKTPKDAKCGKEENKCESGKFEDEDDSEFELKWKCLGINGGKSFECAVDKMCPCKDVNKKDNKCDQKINQQRNQPIVVNNCEEEKEKITELSLRIKELEMQPKEYEEKPEDPDVIVEKCEQKGVWKYFLNPFSFLFLIIVIAILGLRLYIVTNDRRE